MEDMYTENFYQNAEAPEQGTCICSSHASSEDTDDESDFEDAISELSDDEFHAESESESEPDSDDESEFADAVQSAACPPSLPVCPLLQVADDEYQTADTDEDDTEFLTPQAMYAACEQVNAPQGGCPMQQQEDDYEGLEETPACRGNWGLKPRSERINSMTRSRRRLCYDDENAEDDTEPEAPNEVPEKYRFVPSFVLATRQLDRRFFHKMVDFYFENMRWPTFENLPPEFINHLAERGIQDDSFEEMPGFAPKWMFVLNEFSPETNMIAVERFFRDGIIPGWSTMPRHVVRQLKLREIDEFEYY